MNSAGKVSARHGHPRETLNLKRGGRRLTELEHKEEANRKKKTNSNRQSKHFRKSLFLKPASDIALLYKSEFRT